MNRAEKLRDYRDFWDQMSISVRGRALLSFAEGVSGGAGLGVGGLGIAEGYHVQGGIGVTIGALLIRSAFGSLQSEIDTYAQDRVSVALSQQALENLGED